MKLRQLTSGLAGAESGVGVGRITRTPNASPDVLPVPEKTQHSALEETRSKYQAPAGSRPTIA